MMPSENSAKAKSPAIGRSAVAACAAVAMFFTPCRMQGERSGQNDEVRHPIRHYHADVGVDADARKLRRCLIGCGKEWFLALHRFLIFHFSRCLLKE